MPIRFISKGSFKKTEDFLNRMTNEEVFTALEGYGQRGVAALAAATPTDSGETAQAWSYEVVKMRGRHALIFHNSHVVEGRPVAILIQYGHATGTGGYVPGRDYINPVIDNLWKELVNDVWKAVNR